jgi:hypothetical protein
MGFGVTRSALPAAVLVMCVARVACVACVTCTSFAAFAAPPHPPKDAPNSEKTRAADLFKKGSEAYLRGDFAQSIALLDEAYTLDPQPVLIYNLARAHEGLGHIDEAITQYERYLSKEPTSRDRGAIEQRIATLRNQRDDRAALEKERAAAVARERAALDKQRAQPVTEPPPAEPHRRSPYPYVVAGAGAAGVVTGMVFGLLALSREDAAKEEGVQSKSIDLRDTGKTFATVSNVSFVVGGVLLAAGVTWWVLDGPRSNRTGAAPVRVGIGPGFVGVGGTFR